MVEHSTIYHEIEGSGPASARHWDKSYNKFYNLGPEKAYLSFPVPWSLVRSCDKKWSLSVQRISIKVNGATTVSITTFSIMTRSIMGLFMILSITTLCISWHYAEYRISFIDMLSVVMLNVVLLSVIMLNVVMLNVVEPRSIASRACTIKLIPW